MNQEEERNEDLHARCAMLKGTAVKDKDLLVKKQNTTTIYFSFLHAGKRQRKKHQKIPGILQPG